MNREEAARVLSSMRDTLKKVYLVAIDEERISALESAVGFLLADDNNAPVKKTDTTISLEWVKTTDRLPTKEDADDEGKVTALITGMITGKLLSLSLYYASVTAESADYFLPMPKLPEVEE